jgi:D-lactate dehydrogenase
MDEKKMKVAFFETRLNAQSALLMRGFEAVCCFVNDKLDAATLSPLQTEGVKVVALRSAGYNYVYLNGAKILKSCGYQLIHRMQLQNTGLSFIAHHLR